MKKKMKIYRIPFKKIAWGYGDVIAKSKKEALEKFPADLIDEYENKTEYEIEEDLIEVRDDLNE